MADFVLWSVAGEKALGWGRGQFLKAYEANRADANDIALSSSSVAESVIRFMEKRQTWTGAATMLLQDLRNEVPIDAWSRNGLPKQPNGLSGVLRRLAPNLRTHGIDVAFKRGPKGTTRLICLTAVRGGR